MFVRWKLCMCFVMTCRIFDFWEERHFYFIFLKSSWRVINQWRIQIYVLSFLKFKNFVENSFLFTRWGDVWFFMRKFVTQILLYLGFLAKTSGFSWKKSLNFLSWLKIDWNDWFFMKRFFVLVLWRHLVFFFM